MQNEIYDEKNGLTYMLCGDYREEQLVKQMMEKQGITEKLKRQDNMEWTRRMNAICHDAEEMILTEMIYTKG